MQMKSVRSRLEDAVAAVQKAIAEIDNAEDKDAVLRACLALNVPAYRNRLNLDPKEF
ncbi:MAG: hypothetical protein ACLPY1_21960 [Terracidiphilus sp.]